MNQPYEIIGDSNRVITALCDAGVIREPAEMIRRVVIDLNMHSLAIVYVEKAVDDRLLDVILTGGLEVVPVPLREDA